MARRSDIAPYRQGQLDGLCGLRRPNFAMRRRPDEQATAQQSALVH
jgi:hypothetical protein